MWHNYNNDKDNKYYDNYNLTILCSGRNSNWKFERQMVFALGFFYEYDSLVSDIRNCLSKTNSVENGISSIILYGTAEGPQ